MFSYRIEIEFKAKSGIEAIKHFNRVSEAVMPLLPSTAKIQLTLKTEMMGEKD